MPDCGCPSNMKATFFCPKEPKCNGGQVYYCHECCEYHDHGPIAISKRVSEITREWHSIFEEVNQIVARAQNRYLEYKDIIEYCVEVIMQHSHLEEF